MKKWAQREKHRDYRDDINKLIDENIPFSDDLKYHKWITPRVKNITEYKSIYIQPLADIEALSFQEALLGKALHSILYGALSIYIVVILLMYIYIA